MGRLKRRAAQAVVAVVLAGVHPVWAQENKDEGAPEAHTARDAHGAIVSAIEDLQARFDERAAGFAASISDATSQEEARRRIDDMTAGLEEAIAGLAEDGVIVGMIRDLGVRLEAARIQAGTEAEEAEGEAERLHWEEETVLWARAAEAVFALQVGLRTNRIRLEHLRESLVVEADSLLDNMPVGEAPVADGALQGMVSVLEDAAAYLDAVMALAIEAEPPSLAEPL